MSAVERPADRAIGARIKDDETGEPRGAGDLNPGGTQPSPTRRRHVDRRRAGRAAPFEQGTNRFERRAVAQDEADGARHRRGTVDDRRDVALRPWRGQLNPGGAQEANHMEHRLARLLRGHAQGGAGRVGLEPVAPIGTVVDQRQQQRMP